MTKRLSSVISLLILIPLILAACGGDDDDGEDCLDRVDAESLPAEFERDAEASFASGAMYRYPSGWELTEVSEAEHELRVPEAPPILFRILDTEAATAILVPEVIERTDSSGIVNAFGQAYYPGASRVGVTRSPTSENRHTVGGQFGLPCQGSTRIQFFNNANGTTMIVDVSSESGFVVEPFIAVRDAIVADLQEPE